MPENPDSAPRRLHIGKTPLEEGATLGDRYEIRRVLGAGSLGVSYATFDRNRAKEICLKVIWPELLVDSKAKEAFLTEAKIACDLRYPQIVNVYDIHREGDLFFLSMELLSGRTLRTEMEDRKKAGNRFSLAEVRALAEAIGPALTYAHQFTVHRSIKPENIWLTDNGAIKVMDFGLAHCLSRRRATMTTIASATAYYLPPEFVDEEVEFDSRGDQYSLAAVLYEVLTDECLVGIPKDLSEAFPDIPEAAAAALRRALAPKPTDRHDSIQAFCGALIAGLRPNFFDRNRRLVKAAATLAVFAAIGAATLLTDNGASRWVREQVTAIRGPEWERLAEDAREIAETAKYDLEHEWLAMLTETDQLQTNLDSAKEATAINFPTNRFLGMLDRNSATSDWRRLRVRLLNGYYGMRLTNELLPELENETLDVKLAKPTADLASEQTRQLRLWRILAFRVFAPEATREARNKMDLGDSLVEKAKYREAKLNFNEAGELFRKSLDLVQQIKGAVLKFDEAMSAKFEFLALARMNGIENPRLVQRNSERMTHAWAELTTGDAAAAHSESEHVLQSWTEALQELVKHNEDRANAAKEAWLALFEGRPVPRLQHLGAPDKFIEEGKRLTDMHEWYAAHEKFYEARHLYEEWSMAINELPKPPDKSWANSLGMYFVPLTEKIWISIWETRVMDFDVFADSTGHDAKHNWRTLELEANWEQGPTHPVVWIQKPSADAFCQWLTETEKNLTNAIYRLPTDLEWSLAVGVGEETRATPRERSGGVSDVFPWGSGIFPPTHIDPLPGNYDFFVETRYSKSDRHSYTSAVGKFRPQGPFSLYDLGGNVWEFCADLYDEAAPGYGWTIRGGSCFTESRERLESSFRGHWPAASSEIGFRVVLEIR